MVNSIILSGKNHNNISEIYLRTKKENKLQSQTYKEFDITHTNGNFHDTLRIAEGYYDLTVNNNSIPLYLKNGYNLQLNINKNGMDITGTGMIENIYLQKRQILEKKIATKNFYSYYTTLDEKNFLKLSDSIYSLRINLIEKSGLSDSKFRFLEQSFAKLDRAHKLLNYPFIRLRIDQNYVMSKDFPKTFKGININDERLVELPYYSTLMFLKTVNGVVARDGQSSDPAFKYLQFVIDDELKVTNKKLKEVIAYKTVDMTLEKTDSLDKLYNTYRAFAKDSLYLKKITNRYIELKGLEKGSMAPSFLINNKNGESVSLESLKGNVVYVDFWATWCKPCISEIEPSKRLQNKFNGKNIKFVNICIESKYETWNKLVSDKDIQGINLFADKEKEKKLKNDYFIQGLPRYVILDKDGKVFDLNAKKPSNPKLELELREMLQSTYGNNGYSK